MHNLVNSACHILTEIPIANGSLFTKLNNLCNGERGNFRKIKYFINKVKGDFQTKVLRCYE